MAIFLAFMSSLAAAEGPMGLEAYVKIQALLAADQVAGVGKLAEDLSQAAKGDAELARIARALGEAKDIESVRAQFKVLSGRMLAKHGQSLPAGFEVFHCSMAKAGWIQKGAEPRNPYFGKSMLECGERQTLPKSHS